MFNYDRMYLANNKVKKWSKRPKRPEKGSGARNKPQCTPSSTNPIKFCWSLYEAIVLISYIPNCVYCIVLKSTLNYQGGLSDSFWINLTWYHYFSLDNSAMIQLIIAQPTTNIAKYFINLSRIIIIENYKVQILRYFRRTWKIDLENLVLKNLGKITE